jgi:TetR/AcrR family transcriptional regulator, repressor for uid operon
MVQERTRLTHEDRRTAILDAARHEFARKGFRGTGTADIAARCGCSEPMLYKHFASKQELFAAVLRHTGALMSEKVDALLDESGDSVTTLLVEMAELAATDEFVVEVMRLRMLAASLVDEPPVREALEDNMRFMRARIVAMLTRARDRGEVRADLDLEHVAWLWIGFTLSCGFRHALEPEQAVKDSPFVARTFVQMLRPADNAEEAE